MRKRCGSSQSKKNIEREHGPRIACAAKHPHSEAGARSSLAKAEDWKLSLSEQVLRPTEDRYAEDVITDPSRFDAIELHCVSEFSDSDGREYEDSDCDRIPPSGFSVFAHSRNGGVECCGDFTLRSGALDYANGLAKAYQWPIFDYTSPTPRRHPEFIRREALLVMAAKLKEAFYTALDPLDPDTEWDRPAIPFNSSGLQSSAD